ncbi:efflux RND transporter periplasmic adaptor subunit [Legionella sp. km772]|uniref:efflux RND transporter periplasmic adaptor subunit n=1 Tax=Legionella sp. km772 TaxID=2498111 RepID=UPI000F8DD5BC|nr:efflux RND transporter periplasmic adaptor subunit [Legionella sp. km772]RUR08468.1 HlyD family efflux transporter periplasmic adaptor subunit [Legionella sp. km772]
MNHFFKKLALMLLIVNLVACGEEKKQEAAKSEVRTYTVTAKPLHKVLHFTGTVQPIRENSIVSPMEAVVDTMNFHYGQRVKKGEVVLTLNSNELQKQYNDTLTDYLKAKDNYSIIQAKFRGTKELWQAGLLAKNNYLSEKSGVDTARVTLMQASRKLTELLEKMDDNNDAVHLSNLSLADFDKIKKVLTANHNLIHLKATGDGVMLYPPKSGEDKTTRINVGSAVKAGQVIALIGDLQGISVEIDVPEVDIDKIHPGMKATISGVAFGKHQLNGSLVLVNAQASNSSSGGLPSFTALVEVRKLNKEQQAWIKVGMSAAIELKVDSEKQLLIPIAAVKREQGNSVVRLKTPQGRVEKRIVTTGPAQADTVVIETGLKEGDVVVYD